MNPLESIAYGIARGVVRAWFDVQDERKKLEREKVTPEDEVVIDRFASAVHAVDSGGVRPPAIDR